MRPRVQSQRNEGVHYARRVWFAYLRSPPSEYIWLLRGPDCIPSITAAVRLRDHQSGDRGNGARIVDDRTSTVQRS